MTTSGIECTFCEKRFTEGDILKLNYFLDSRLCYECSKKLYKSDSYYSCFGKQYEPLALECRLLCPDRKVCPLFFSRKIFRLRKKFKNELVNIAPVVLTRRYPFRSGTLIDKAFKLCCKSVTKDKLKTWCAQNNTSYYRVLRVLRKGEKYGKKWKVHETQDSITLEYAF